MFEPRRIRHIGGGIDHLVLVIGHKGLKLHRRYRRDDGHVKLTFQTLLHNLHVQHSQKPATESEAQGSGSFRFPNQRGIIELQLFHGST